MGTFTAAPIIILLLSLALSLSFTPIEAELKFVDSSLYDFYNTSAKSGMTADLREMLLFEHNDFRRQEFTASNMNELEWSWALEAEAAKWVNRCQFGKQGDREWGENVYRSTYKTSAENTISNAILAWTLEKYNIMKSPTGWVDCCSKAKKTCCLYTQMVWAKSEYIGCAMRECDLLKGEVADDDYRDAMYIACYFYPRGSNYTEQPFLKGRNGPCSDCQPNNPDCNDGLCYYDTGSRC